MPSCRAFSSAAAEAILAASRVRQGRGLVAIVGFAGVNVGVGRGVVEWDGWICPYAESQRYGSPRGRCNTTCIDPDRLAITIRG